MIHFHLLWSNIFQTKRMGKKKITFKKNFSLSTLNLIIIIISKVIIEVNDNLDIHVWSLRLNYNLFYAMFA
jgi:hypothetical protein